MPRTWLVLALALAPGFAQRTGPGQADLLAIESSFDNKLKRTFDDIPFLLLDRTNGTYIDGFGAVFTSTVNLVMTPNLNPFKQEVSAEDKLRFQQAKVKKLPQLRQLMTDFLVSSAGAMDKLPPEESIVLSVKLFYQPWELHQGLPERVMVSGQKRRLVDLATQRVGRAQLDTIVKTRELY